MSARDLTGRHFGSGPSRSSLGARKQDNSCPAERVPQTSKHSDLPLWQPAVILALLCTVLLLSGLALAGVTASISGTVKDGTGAVIAQAMVTAKNTETGIVETRRTNEQGFYSFQSLPLGHYDVEVQQTGFTGMRRTGLVLDVNSALVVDFTMEVGLVKEMVTVSTDAVQVDTATTHLGEVISSNQMTGVPLVSRSYTDLLALQPGVAPVSSGLTGGGAGVGGSSNLISAGFAVPLVSGDLNAGNFSVNGMREGSNGFLLNGATVQEFGFSGTSVVPNLDSIAEFRILTNNFDAEYGNYSGGQVNVITKSGANEFHGNLFEFLRNTNLDARNFFDPVGQKGAYHQNQFGGTFGGPVKKNKVFFFADYQGNRKVIGVTQTKTLPTDAMRGGDFSAVASQLDGAVQGPLWATQLSGKLGYPVVQGEPYYTPGCVNSAACVFPNAQIPASVFAGPSKNLLQYIPTPGPDGTFSTSSSSMRLNDSKFSGRMDANTRFGMLSAYYVFDDYTLNNPYPTASVPGFNALGTGRTQVINLGSTKTLGNSAVNEFRYQFVRVNDSMNKPAGGKGVTLSSLGFITGGNGIVALAPQLEGVPEIDFNNFAIGVPSRVLGLVENTHQWLDNFSKVIGTHTLKFGGSYRYTQMGEYLSNVMNGQFQFFGSETGIDFADFLLGAPTYYVQGQAPPSLGRSRYGGAYAQDSWRARPNLTINYGVRWEFSTPWYEKNNNLETLVPGLQSKVFPGAPTGWVFPGDPGIPRTLAPTRYNNFAPRLGIAYSPGFNSGLLSKLTGGPGKTSIRVGWGMFYTSFEGATNFNEIGDPPYGYYYVGSAPSFTEPFLDRGTGNPQNQRFPVTFPPNGVSASNPYTALDWSKFLPIGSSPGFWYKNRLPYAEDYELSIERQIRNNTVLTVSYVGTQAHRLLSTVESNPGNPALCLSLSQPSQVAPGSPTCGPGGENTVYTRANGTVVNGTRAPFGNNFGSNGYFMTIGQSGYNSLQVNVRHNSSRLQFLAGYTFSKSLDNSSGYGEQVNPFNPKASMALSSFDVTHNFVFSYNYRLPFDKLGGPKRLTNGWELSGITRFATGIPVYLYDTIDTSLLGTAYTGPITLGIDTPDFNGTSIHTTDPRTRQPFFNIGDFSQAPLGQLGTARRRFFHGPGINNWDMALLKDTAITERIRLQFRAEFFNVFNHAQFLNPDGNISGQSFGMVQSARDPRIGQMSVKLQF